MKRSHLVSLVLIVLVAGGYAAWHARLLPTQASSASNTPGAAPPAVPVTLATVARIDFPVYLNGLGTVQGLNTVTVRSRVDGQVDTIAFKEGQPVKQGDLIAQIDPRPYQAALDQAKAKKAQDQANLANAQLDLQRYTKLGDFATRQ